MLRLETILLVWIAIGVLEVTLCFKFYGSLFPGPVPPCIPGQPCSPEQIVYGSAVPGPIRPCPPGQPCSALQPFYRPKPLRPALSAKYSYKKNPPRNPCISDFVCTFVDKVHKCPELVELFGSFDQISAEEFCYGKYSEILVSLIENGASNPEFSAQQAVEPIVDYFDYISSDIVIEVYANFIAKHLLTQGILTPQNAVQLAKQYADTMEEAAKCNDSEYAALSEGFINFLESLGLFTADKALLIALQYANEWKMVAKQPQLCLKPNRG